MVEALRILYRRSVEHLIMPEKPRLAKALSKVLTS